MDDKLEFADEWTEHDSFLCQSLADYLATTVAGFVPRPERVIQGRQNPGVPYLPNLDLEIWRNVLPIMHRIILSAMVHGTDDERKQIIAAVKPERFWSKSFEKYLFEFMIEQHQRTGEISIASLQLAVPEHSRIVYGEPASKRWLLQCYASWAQILSFRPAWPQVLASIEKVNSLSKPRGA